MSHVAEAMKRLKVTVESPDKTVRVRFAKQTGMNVELQPHCISSHTGESLSYQVEESFYGALKGYRQAYEIVLAERQSGEHGRPLPLEAMHSLRERIEERVAELEVTGTSSHGYVTVSWLGQNDIVVGIDEAALSRLTRDRMETELSVAFTNAHRLHSKARLAIRNDLLHDRYRTARN